MEKWRGKIWKSWKSRNPGNPAGPGNPGNPGAMEMKSTTNIRGSTSLRLYF